MKTERHALRQVDLGNRRRGKILRIDNPNMARAGLAVVNKPHLGHSRHPRRTDGHENPFARRALRPNIVYRCHADFQVMLQQIARTDLHFEGDA